MVALAAMAMRRAATSSTRLPRQPCPRTRYTRTRHTSSRTCRLYTKTGGRFSPTATCGNRWSAPTKYSRGLVQALKEDGGRRGSLDKYDALLTSELSFVVEQWEKRWPTVGEAAKIINAIGGGNLAPGTKKASLYGEACFIRGGS